MGTWKLISIKAIKVVITRLNQLWASKLYLTSTYIVTYVFANLDTN